MKILAPPILMLPWELKKKKGKKREVICSFVVWGQIRHFVQYSNIILLLEKFLEVPPPGAVGSEFFFGH